MTDITITYLIIVGAVALFVWNRLPVAVVALLTPMALFYTGILDVREVVAGFGDPVVLFVASLLVLGTALEAAGVTNWAGQGLVKRAGASPVKLTLPRFHVHQIVGNFLMNGERYGQEGAGCEPAVHG